MLKIIGLTLLLLFDELFVRITLLLQLGRKVVGFIGKFYFKSIETLEIKRCYIYIL